jgi:hypothetical protein
MLELFSADGRRAYVLGTTLLSTKTLVVPIDVATNRAGQPVVVPGFLFPGAMALYGQTAYVSASTSLSGGDYLVPVDLTNGDLGRPIPLGMSIQNLYIAPGSSAAYAMSEGSADAGGIPVELKTGAVGQSIPVPSSYQAGAIGIVSLRAGHSPKGSNPTVTLVPSSSRSRRSGRGVPIRTRHVMGHDAGPRPSGFPHDAK